MKIKKLMKTIYFWLLLTIPLWFLSCSKDPEMESGGFKLPLRSIYKFEITPFYNGEYVGMTHSAVIDEARKTIMLSLPYNIITQNPSALSCDYIPSITFSRGANITPKNLSPISLKFNPEPSDSILYTVISEDGRQAVYTLRWKYDFKNKKADILCYEFPDIMDPLTGLSFRTGNATTWMKYPRTWFTYDTPIQKDIYGDEIGTIRMRIILSQESMNATISQPLPIEAVFLLHKFLQNPTRLSLEEPFICYHNFKQPLYTFTITSEDGKTAKNYFFTVNWDPAL
jgi:hypothetical protein